MYCVCLSEQIDGVIAIDSLLHCSRLIYKIAFCHFFVEQKITEGTSLFTFMFTFICCAPLLMTSHFRSVTWSRAVIYFSNPFNNRSKSIRMPHKHKNSFIFYHLYFFFNCKNKKRRLVKNKDLAPFKNYSPTNQLLNFP